MKLSDLYGRKPFFLTAISIFIVGSVLCTFSTSMYQLAIFRAVQGLGAGGLMSLAFAIIGDLVPPRERARYQGNFLAVSVRRASSDGWRVVPSPGPRRSWGLPVGGGCSCGSGNAGGVLQDSSFLQHIDPRLTRPFLVGFSNAMDEVFLVAAGVMFIAFVLLLFLEEVPLRTQSGIQALAAEHAAELITGAQSARTTVRHDGQFTVVGLGPGSYTVITAAAGMIRKPASA